MLVSEVNASIERQKDQLKQIAENEQRLKLILDGAGDACLLFDLIDGEIVYANQAAFHLLDFSESELLNKHIFDISPSLDAIEWNERVRIVTANRSHQREARCWQGVGIKSQWKAHRLPLASTEEHCCFLSCEICGVANV
ncbi:PAS domain-containing protein [Pseudomonadales bacterium]|nr:PAS domain-containing protein [Pseudomonadales bacterium]